MVNVLRIRNIIVATDLTDALAPALQSAAQLAQLNEAHLHIVHTTVKEIPESSLENHLRAAGISRDERVDARILVGPPGALITQEAARLGADVIILGPHRPTGRKLGSTAYRVMHGSQTPCLMLPRALSLPLHNVLIPLDISGPARGALAIAIMWASALRRRAVGEATTLTALHVLTDRDGEDRDSTIAVTNEVARVRREFASLAGVAIKSIVETGTPASVIAERARSDAADLVVMGTRGQNPHEASLGSVALQVVTHAECPVLLVPPGAWRRYSSSEQPRSYPDLVDDTLDDSFPASDPPSWAGQ